MENDHEMKRVLPPNLPYEIVFDILSRLPVKSLCRFKSVSKPWLALITDPQFIQSHLHQSMKSDVNHKVIIAPRHFHSSESFYSVDYLAPVHTVAELDMPYKSDVDILGSFNGVLLLQIQDELCLWNPSIRMYQKFSQPNSPVNHDLVKLGLGYDSIGDDFKVVAVFDAVCDTTIVHVFSSKISSWKSIGDFDYCYFLVGRGTVLNGAQHWFGLLDMYLLIVCFDVTEEKFKEVPMFINEVEDDFLILGVLSLGVLGGWLCVVDNREYSHSDVWVMKEYGVKESWTKLFVVPNVLGEFFFDYFELLCFTKDGEVVVMLKSHDSAKLVIYNADNKTYRRIGIPQDCKGCDVSLYVESLVSPHARVLEGANEMEMEAKVDLETLVTPFSGNGAGSILKGAPHWVVGGSGMGTLNIYIDEQSRNSRWRLNLIVKSSSNSNLGE